MGWGGLFPYPPEKGYGGGGVEAAFLPLIKEAAWEGLNHPEDFLALPLA
jgi:hypothetical protein